MTYRLPSIALPWLIAVTLVVACVGDRSARAQSFENNVNVLMVDDHFGQDYSDELNRGLDGVGENAGCPLPLDPDDPDCPIFRRSILEFSDFTGARFDGADWSFGEIVDTIFEGATFLQTDLDDIWLERNDFTDADLSDADMRRATIRGGDYTRALFANANLTDAQLRCIALPNEDPDDPESECPNLTRADFQGANLTGVLIAPAFNDDQIRFSAASFREATLVDTVWAAVDRPCLQTDEVDNLWECMTIASDPPSAVDKAEVDGLLILNTSDLRGSDWRELTLREFELPGANIAGARFDATTIEEADFSNTQSSCAEEDDDDDDPLCDFFVGEDGAAAHEHTSFANASISDADFTGADLRDADFTDATLTRVVFDEMLIGCATAPPAIPADCNGCCQDCVDFAGAFDGQTAQSDGSYNISASDVDWDNYFACSAILALEDRALVDDMSHIRLDRGSFEGQDVTAVDFIGASLRDVSFEQATILGVDFTDADLTRATFHRQTNNCAAGAPCNTFDGATLVDAILTSSDFRFSTFDGANLDGAVLVAGEFGNTSFVGTASELVSMVGTNLSASTFDNAIFTFVDFTDGIAICGTEDGEQVCASFVSAVFTNSDLSNADLRGADLSGASFPGSDLSGAVFGAAIFDDQTSFETATIDGIDLSLVNLGDAAPDLFQDLDTDELPDEPAGVILSGRDLDDFDFSGVDLRNWNFEGASLARADFTGSTNTGADFGLIQFDDLLDPANPDRITVDTNFFAGTDLTFADLQGLDLTGFDLSGVVLRSANLGNTNFENATLSGADFTGVVQICNSDGCADLTDAALDCVDFGLVDITQFVSRNGATAVDDDQFFQRVDSNLAGLDLSSRSLTGYKFTGVVPSIGLDLSGATLQSNDLREADFSNAVLHGTRFDGSSFCSSVFGDPECATFTNADLVGSTDCNDQEGAVLSNIDFSNAPLELFDDIVDASAACVDLRDSDLSRVTVEIEGEDDELRGFDFTDFTNYSGAVIAGASLRHQDFSDTVTLGAAFFAQFGHAAESVDTLCSGDDDIVATIDETPDLRGTDFACADVSNQQFTDADLEGASFLRATLNGASFPNANLSITSFVDVDFTDPTVVDIFQGLANAPDPNFSENPPDRVDEDGIPYPNLQRVNFSFADFTQMGGNFNLNHVDLESANLSGARLVNADLRDAILDNPVSLCDEADGDGTTCSPDVHPQTCLDISGAMVEGTSFRFIQFTELFEFQPDDLDAARNFFQNIDGDNMRGTNFTGSNVAGLDFSDMDLRDAGLFGVTRFCDTEENQGCAQFTRARFGGSDRDGPLGIWNDRQFDDTNDDKISFAGASFDHINLAGSDFSDVDPALCVEGTNDCFTITGENTRLESSVFDGLDLTRTAGQPDPFGADGTDDAVTRFASASFRHANLSGLGLQDRNFTGGDFTAANLAQSNLGGSLLESATFGCNDGECSNLDGAALCGVEASGATFEGSFAGTSFFPQMADFPSLAADCATPARLRFVRFEDSSLATLDLSMANLEGATFTSDVDFCNASADCLDITGATLVGTEFTGVDFDELPDDWFEAAGIDDLSESSFANADLSGKDLGDIDFEDAILSGADLRDASLESGSFEDTQFALGATTVRGLCTLANGGTRVDLRGANLQGADFSRARNFHRGCIRVNATTTYDDATRFPSGFDLIDEMTQAGGAIVIPEPRGPVLQIVALVAISILAARRRYTSPA